MLDKDLATLYRVETGQLKRAVQRNINRFPDDFMVELIKEEFKNLRCQFGTSSWRGQRYLPFAFTKKAQSKERAILHSCHNCVSYRHLSLFIARNSGQSSIISPLII